MYLRRCQSYRLQEFKGKNFVFGIQPVVRERGESSRKGVLNVWKEAAATGRCSGVDSLG